LNSVIVYVEQEGGAARRLGLEMCTKGADLAQELGVPSAVVVLGPGAARVAQQLKKTPVDALLVGEDVPIDRFLLDPAVDVLEAIVKERGPALVLLPASNSGKDIAARIAVRLAAGVITEANDIAVQAGQVSVKSPKFGGSIVSTVEFKNSENQVVVCRANSFSSREEPGKGELIPITAPAKTSSAVIKETVAAEAGELTVDEAAIVVSGGRGLGAPEHFAMIKALADALGGAVGASRAAVDAGWISHQHQVGQTGKAVSPQLYIACGISGAIQHKVGMRSAGIIVAINKDPNAPIYEFSDLGVVGDIFQIVPELTKLVKERRGVA